MCASGNRHRTPDQILGPYFPVRRGAFTGADLTRIEGGNGQAQGEIIEVAGRIINLDGEPISGARLTIWQANSFGRYRHPNDRNVAPLDPNFVGCTRNRMTTAAMWSRPSSPAPIRQARNGHVRRIFISRYRDGSNGW